MKTAIVILNWNGSEMLRTFLPSVISSIGKDDEVVVVDNASTDNSVHVVQEEFPSVRLVVLDKNYGFADGYNIGLRSIEAEYYVLLNSDVEVDKEWLNPLTDYMDSNTDVAACQPKIRSYRNKNMFEYAGASGGWIDRLGYPYCRGRIFSTVEKDMGQYDSTTDIFWATGAALMIRSSDFWEAGGLDGRFFAHMEEIDLCWRLRSRGRRIVCIPQSIVYHVGGATLSKQNPHKTFLNFRNNLLLLYKNLPEQELSSVIFTRMILDGIAALQFAAKMEWGNVKAIYRAHCEFRNMKAEFAKSRQTNLEKAKVHSIPERTNRSILVDYFIKRHRKWSDL